MGVRSPIMRMSPSRSEQDWAFVAAILQNRIGASLPQSYPVKGDVGKFGLASWLRRQLQGSARPTPAP
jgi:hypothetical protein